MRRPPASAVARESNRPKMLEPSVAGVLIVGDRLRTSEEAPT